METIKSLAKNVILILFVLILFGWYPSKNKSNLDTDSNVIVLLKFKAQPNKGNFAISEFNKLLNKVKQEPNFISIKLHIDPDDDTNILLYEEWSDKDYYNTDHMNSIHIKEFMANSVNFLTGPPEITFWEIKNVFN